MADDGYLVYALLYFNLLAVHFSFTYPLLECIGLALDPGERGLQLNLRHRRLDHRIALNSAITASMTLRRITGGSLAMRSRGNGRFPRSIGQCRLCDAKELRKLSLRQPGSLRVIYVFVNL
jgi:hypothetical protein